MRKKLFYLLVFSFINCWLFAQTNVACLTKQYHPHYSNGLGWNGKMACLADNYFFWDNGKTLYIKFMNGSRFLQKQTTGILKEIELHANVRFEITTGMSNIRIGFNNNKVVGTALGTMCNMFPQDETTTTIDSTYQSDKAIYKTLVLHTMLHVLGLQDEIVGLQNNFSWNDIKMNDFFTAIQLNKTLSISTSEQYKRKYTLNFSNDFKHNPSSIMLAPIPNTFSQKYTNVKWNKSISENDKKVIQAIYPKRIKKNDTINPIIVFKHLVIQQSVQKDGYSFYPQFKVTSHNKNQSFHLMLFIYNEEGNPIYSSNDSYSLDGQLGDIISKVSGIAKQEDVNSPSLNDVELFIPNFLLQPELKKQKLFAVFKIYYTNSEMEDKWLFVSKPCSIK